LEKHSRSGRKSENVSNKITTNNLTYTYIYYKKTLNNKKINGNNLNKALKIFLKTLINIRNIIHVVK